MSTNNTTFKAIKWSTLGHVIPQVFTPLVTIYIARLLTPEAFGIVAIATIVISFLKIFLSVGFTTALIQKKGLQDEIYNAANFVFTFNLVLSILFYGIIVVSSSSIASFFNNYDAQLVIAVLSLDLVIRAFGDVQLAMMQRNMEFKAIFFRQLVPVISLVLITLPLAWLGYGVWALVIGTLCSQILSSIILWLSSPWKPKLDLKIKRNLPLLKFGVIVAIESLTIWVISQGDNLVVGKYLSTQDLGLYRTGFDLDARIFSLLIAPLTPVIYSRLCSISDEPKKNQFYLKTKKYIGMVVFPTMAGIVLVSDYFDNLILGDKWMGISFIMATLALSPGYLWINLPAFLKSKGKPHKSTLLSIVSAVLSIPVYLVFIKFGLNTFVISKVILGIILGLTLFTYIEAKELNMSILKLFKSYLSPLIASLIMFLFGHYFQNSVLKTHTFFSLASLITLCGIVYIIIITAVSKNDIVLLKQYIKKER